MWVNKSYIIRKSVLQRLFWYILYLVILAKKWEKREIQVANLKILIQFFHHRNSVLTTNHAEGIVLAISNIKPNYIKITRCSIF